MNQLMQKITRHPASLSFFIIFLFALILRLSYVTFVEIPFADPWRHMALIRSIRSGAGFTLFADQPYIWYSPVWYYVAACLAEPENVKWLSAAVSALTVPAFSVYLYRKCDGDLKAAAVGGILMAGFGPQVAFTCQLGAEAFALFLLVCALLLSSYGKKSKSAFLSGILLGLSVSSRLQFGPFLFLFFAEIQRLPRRLVFLFGAAVPLLVHWLRNLIVIQNHPYVFTWDGMATSAGEYNWLTTLFVQAHPKVAEACRQLYASIKPLPEWLHTGMRIRWEIIIFFLLTMSCVFYARRFWLIASVLVTATYLLFLDTTHSARFFRIWLGLFPLLFVGTAFAIRKMNAASFHAKRSLTVFLAIVVLACGGVDLIPKRAEPLEMVTPPAELVKENNYMVNSGFFQPESLIYRYPSKRFIGMPLAPEMFDDFSAAYPSYRLMIWRKSFNVQKRLLQHLIDSNRLTPIALEKNPYGFVYLLAESK
jgi:hypothetical protein